MIKHDQQASAITLRLSGHLEHAVWHALEVPEVAVGPLAKGKQEVVPNGLLMMCRILQLHTAKHYARHQEKNMLK